MGIMTWLIRIFAKIFTKLMRVSGAESLCASSNIFVGIESATTIRPYLEKMTRSELCTILTAGMATIASTVLAIYILILQKQFPTIAGHLVSASFLSAPAAIIMSKLLMPETGKPETLGIDVKPHYEKESSVIEAIINGANAGLKLAVGVVALLVAFLGLVALADFISAGLGAKVNGLVGLNIDWSLKGLLGYVFYPFTLIIGVPPADAFEISKVIGERAIVTETKSYMDLAALMDAVPCYLCPLRLCTCSVPCHICRRNSCPCPGQNCRSFRGRPPCAAGCNTCLSDDCIYCRDFFQRRLYTFRAVMIH
jgi:CNT family concentrative nucleoside transporter